MSASVTRAEADPAGHERRRRELPHGDLDEHERGAPEQRDGGQHGRIAARSCLLVTHTEGRLCPRIHWIT